MLQEQGFSELDGKMLACWLRDVLRARDSTSDNSENSLFFVTLSGGESQRATNLPVFLVASDESAIPS